MENDGGVGSVLGSAMRAQGSVLQCGEAYSEGRQFLCAQINEISVDGEGKLYSWGDIGIHDYFVE